MTKNHQLAQIAREYANDEIDEPEYIRRTLDELAYQHSVSFWSKVMEMKGKHDYATQPIQK